MKKRLTPLSATLAMLAFLTGCTGPGALEPDTPANAGIVLTNAMRAKDYDLFRSYFTDARKDAVPESDFERFSDAYEGAAGYTLYEVVSLPGGEMFLIRLAPPVGDRKGLYKAEDMVEIPEEMKAFFGNR